MKHIKKFENKQDDEIRRKREDQVELFSDLLDENPLSKDHDFYIFIGRDNFKESKDGMYKKTLEIENMVKLTPDESSIASIQGMQMRAMFQGNCSLYHIWLPKELEDDISGKSSNRMESWLVDLIDKYKRKGADQHGREIYKKVVDKGDYKGRKDAMRKYNIGL